MRYRSGDDSLELRYDLWHTRPAGRRFNDKEYVPPALESPLAVQGDGGTLQVGSATLRTTAGAMVWLIAQELDASARSWTAVHPGGESTSFQLDTPLGVVRATSWGTGRVEWRTTGSSTSTSSVSVDCVDGPVGLQVPDGVHVELHR